MDDQSHSQPYSQGGFYAMASIVDPSMMMQQPQPHQSHIPQLQAPLENVHHHGHADQLFGSPPAYGEMMSYDQGMDQSRMTDMFGNPLHPQDPSVHHHQLQEQTTTHVQQQPQQHQNVMISPMQRQQVSSQAPMQIHQEVSRPPEQQQPPVHHQPVKEQLYQKLDKKQKAPKKKSAVANCASGGVMGPSTVDSHPSLAKLREFISKLSLHKLDAFTDRDFGEKTLMNIARKISGQPSVMGEWEKAIVNRDASTGCVCIQRPREGRITVTKSTGNAGSKKIFPQIVLCQMFRFPAIVFHHDIKSNSSCTTPAVVKPSIEVGVDPSDLICLNPYHYDISPEAEARFLKHDRKAAKPARKAVVASRQPPPALDDENESDGEVHAFVDDGVDYVKLWDEQTKSPANADDEMIEFDEEKMLQEIRYVRWSPESHAFVELEGELMEELKLKEELRALVFSGKYSDEIKRVKDEIDAEKKVLESRPERRQEEEQPSAICSYDAPQGDIVLQPITGNEQMEDRSFSGLSFGEKPAGERRRESEDDNAIQNLLEDIRGSFERQFDDEFNDLSKGVASNEPSNGAAAVAAAAAAAGGRFVNITDAFNLNSDHSEAVATMDIPDFTLGSANPVDRNDRAALGANADQELCIINSWTVPETGQGAAVNSARASGAQEGGFLNAGSISQEEFDNFFPMLTEGATDPREAEVFRQNTPPPGYGFP